MAAVQSNGVALEYADETLQKDPEIQTIIKSKR